MSKITEFLKEICEDPSSNLSDYYRKKACEALELAEKQEHNAKELVVLFDRLEEKTGEVLNEYNWREFASFRVHIEEIFNLKT